MANDPRSPRTFVRRNYAFWLGLPLVTGVALFQLASAYRVSPLVLAFQAALLCQMAAHRFWRGSDTLRIDRDGIQVGNEMTPWGHVESIRYDAGDLVVTANDTEKRYPLDGYVVMLDHRRRIFETAHTAWQNATGQAKEEGSN